MNTDFQQADLPFASRPSNGSGAAGIAAGPGQAVQPARSKSDPAGVRSRDDHLREARRLARDIARAPYRSAKQAHIGRLVCHHLVAMLEETP